MKSTSIDKPTVLIFKETLLPLSETFISAQAKQLTQFAARYVGLGRVSPSLPIPDDSILLTRSISRASDLRQKLYRRTGVAPAFHRRAAETNAQLIHAHFASGGRSALPLSRHLKIPLIVTLHGSDVTIQVDFRKRYKELWREASAFICVSDFIRRKALDAGFPEQKLVKHFIGIDAGIFSPTEIEKQSNLILFVGRLVEKKGCEYLLRAMEQVQKRNSGARTVVIGDGPLRSSLETLARTLNLSCDFLGALPPSTVREWMSRARVFCAPSLTAANGDSEGLGMVFAEAQATGTPIVSFHHGGIPEVVVHERTGLLAPEGDQQTLAQYISRLIDDQAFWEKCVETGREWIRTHFDLQNQTHELEQLYGEVLSGAELPSAARRRERMSAAESRA